MAAGLAAALAGCGAAETSQKAITERIDSLCINLRCVSTSASQIARDYLLPGQKKAGFKMEYIKETWPDTITRAQAQRLALIQDMNLGYEKLLVISKDLQQQSVRQLEQLKKLNDEINAGRLNEENIAQYLTFESKCADTLNKVLDTLVKRSIELSCKSQSL